MSNTIASGRSEAWPLQPAVEDVRDGVGPPIIIVATCFNMALCFIKARHWATIGTAQVIAVQLAILAVVVFLVLRRIGGRPAQRLSAQLGMRSCAEAAQFCSRPENPL